MPWTLLYVLCRGTFGDPLLTPRVLSSREIFFLLDGAGNLKICHEKSCISPLHSLSFSDGFEWKTWTCGTYSCTSSACRVITNLQICCDTRASQVTRSTIFLYDLIFRESHPKSSRSEAKKTNIFNKEWQQLENRNGYSFIPVKCPTRTLVLPVMKMKKKDIMYKKMY